VALQVLQTPFVQLVITVPQAHLLQFLATSILTTQALALLVQQRVLHVLQAKPVIREVCQHLMPLVLFVKLDTIVLLLQLKLPALLVITVQRELQPRLNVPTDTTIKLRHKQVVRNVPRATIVVMLLSMAEFLIKLLFALQETTVL